MKLTDRADAKPAREAETASSSPAIAEAPAHGGIRGHQRKLQEEKDVIFYGVLAFNHSSDPASNPVANNA